jgi:hypothetical protein
MTQTIAVCLITSAATTVPPAPNQNDARRRDRLVCAYQIRHAVRPRRCVKF